MSVCWYGRGKLVLDAAMRIAAGSEGPTGAVVAQDMIDAQ